MNKKYILASASPRRQELLGKVVEYFKIVVPDVDETIENKDVEKIPEILAKRKSSNVFENHNDSIIIAADTIVVSDGKVLGKPKNREDAINMLKSLSNKTHEVITGCCVMSNEKEKSFSMITKVKFKDLSDQEIEEYVNTGEPLDKAGAYGYQGKGYFLVESICGDFYNVVGLPIAKLREVLKEF